MSHSDSASFSVNFNIPPEVIEKYFDGLAKVESAKHRPQPSNTSGFDWSSLIGLLPICVPMIAALSSSFASEKMVKSPVAARSKRDNIDDEIITQKLDDQATVIETIIQTLNIEPNSNELVASIVSDVIDRVNDQVESVLKSEEVKVDPLIGAKSSEIKLETPAATPEKSDKGKRPSYTEESTTLPVNPLMAGLGSGENGMAGMADMMKMFEPLMGGLLGAMGNPNGFNPAMLNLSGVGVSPVPMESIVNIKKESTENPDSSVKESKAEAVDKSPEEPLSQ